MIEGRMPALNQEAIAKIAEDPQDFVRAFAEQLTDLYVERDMVALRSQLEAMRAERQSRQSRLGRLVMRAFEPFIVDPLDVMFGPKPRSDRDT